MLRDNWLKWFERRIQVGQSLRRARRTTRRRFASKRTQTTAAWVAQELEQRTLLTTFTVDTLVDESDGNFDPGDLSLREAIEQANANPGADTVQFANGLQGGVIDLTLGTLNVTDDVTVVGTNNPIVLTSNGLVLQASGPGNTLAFGMTGVGVNDTVAGPGLLIDATDDAVVNANISNSFFNNAAEEGIKINADTGGTARLTLTDSSVNSNGDVTFSAGISVDVGVAAQAESTNVPGQFAFASLNMSDVDVQNNALEGLDVTARTGGRYATTTAISNVQFVGNGYASTRNQIDMNASGAGSSILGRFDMATADGAKASGFNFVATAGANVAAVINNSSANNAGADAFNLLADGPGSTAAVSIDNFAGDNAGRSGAEFNVTGGAQVRVNKFNNVSMQNAGASAIDVNMIGGGINAFNGSNVNVSGSGLNGLDLFLRSGVATVSIDGLTSDNNVERGVQVTSIVAAEAHVTLNNVSLLGNQTKQPLNVVVITDSSLDLNVNGGTISSAGTDPSSSVFAVIDNNATGNLSFSGVTVNNSTSSAFSVRYARAAMGSLNISNTTATGSQSVGLALFVTNGSQVTGDFDGLDVSGSGTGLTADGVRIDVTGPGSTGDFMLNNVTANSASRRGIAFLYANGASGAVTKFDNVSAQGAQQDGLMVDVRGNSQLTSFTGNGVNLTNAGQSGNPSFDGLDLIVQGGGATGSMNLQNLTANFAAGRAINLSVQNNAVADVVVDGFAANNSGLEGLNLAVGTGFPGAVLQNSAFRNGSFSNSGAGGSSDGIRALVAGTGSSANVNFSNVSADANSRNGVDATVTAGGDLTLGIENASTANNNFLQGVHFRADGPTTTAALTSTVAGSTFNGNNDTGLHALLTNGANVSDITVLGGASNNGNNGVHIDARPGVTLNNLFVGGGGSTYSVNDETGLLIEVDGVLGLGSVAIDGVTANANMGVATGVNVMLANLTVDDVALTNITTQNNTGDGLTLLLDGVTVNNNLDMTGFNMSGNMGDGVDTNLINSTAITGTMNIDGNSGGNGGDGVKIVANDASGVSIGTFAVSGANLAVNGNMGNGLTVDFDTVSGISSFDLSGMVITNNQGDQAFVRFANMVDPVAISFDDATATGPGGGATGDGIDLTIDNTTATSLDLNRINASDNGGDGLKLNLLNGAVIPSTSIDVGTFDNNGENGIGINVTSSTATIDITNSTFDLLSTIASASFNGNDGLRVRLDDADLTMNAVDQIIFDGNGRIGVNIEGATPSTFTSDGSFTNNTVINNGSFGFRGVFNGGDFDISIGSRTTAGMGNLFDNNTGAGISLDMIQDSMGRFTVIDNTIINTNDDGNPATPFQGAGIFVRMLGTSNPAQATNTLTSGGAEPGLLIRDNKIGVDAADMAAGNAGTGINFQVEERSVIDGLHVHDNRVDNSGIDGLNFVRLDEVVVSGFEILRSTFNDGGDDGVEIFGQNDDNSAMFVKIADNEMNRNGNDGAAFQVLAEARIDLNMDDNMIVQNGDDGMQITDVILDVSDSRRVTGNVERNVIADNANRGINISGAVIGLDFNDNTIGILTDVFDQVVYLGNGSTGVEINGPGSTYWNRNDIRGNGRLVTADRTVGHGIDIQGAGFKFVSMTDNLIRENFQDGIEFLNDGNFSATFTLNMVDNRVQNNAGRGLDVLNRIGSELGTRSEITIYRGTTGNVFNSNGEEGIYAVNTASTTQTQDGFAGDALMQDGSVRTVPQLSLVIDHATVSNNGDPANVGSMVASAGVVMRVGSSDSSRVTESVGSQPVSDEFATFNSSYSGDIGSPFFPSFANGGVFMGLTNTDLAGNFGVDVFTHGYRSTSDAGSIGGTWSDSEFMIAPGSNGDPLARLDMVWGGNTYEALDLNNGLRRGTPDGEAGAFYDNADGAFKSRVDTATPAGPFKDAGRRRNAQRVPARTYDGGFTLSPSIGPVLSPNVGYGSSTASLGDINGDGIVDAAIGAPGIAGGSTGGAVFIQFLNDDGTINSTTEISGGLNGGPTLATGDLFGSSLTSLGDLDGDGIGDVAVGAAGDDTGGADRGAVYVLFLNADGTVKSSVKIDDGTANAPTLADGDAFGSALSAIPPATAGITPATLAVGASGDDTGGTDRGAIYTLTINPDGTVAVGTTKIADSTNGGPVLADGDLFGTSVTAIGDLNGDTFMDWAVGAIGDDSGGINQGAVYILFMNGAGTVGSFQEISEVNGGGPTLFPSDFFGTSVTRLTDLDGDTVDDLAVGAPGINVGGPDRGGAFVLLMNANGTVKSVVRSADGDPNVPTLDDGDLFGSGVASIGDLDADGVDDLVIGARGDDTQANNGGAAYIVFMNADGTIKGTEKIGVTAPNSSTPDLGRFLYPGMGESTFRVFTGGGAAPAGFADDDSPFVGPGSANGTGFTPTTVFGELPFGWGTY